MKKKKNIFIIIYYKQYVSVHVKAFCNLRIRTGHGNNIDNSTCLLIINRFGSEHLAHLVVIIIYYYNERAPMGII